jgi:hypothetical protein
VVGGAEADEIESDEIEADEIEADEIEIPSPPRTRTGQSNEHRARTRLQ